MSHRVITMCLAGLLASSGSGWAADGKSDSGHDKKVAAAHRTMAEAHSNAAKCLDRGTAEKECHAQLTNDCKGAGIGKYCGMKHRH